MTDRDAVDFLKKKLGNYAAVARTLGMSPQAISNWRDPKRGISAEKRATVWMLINKRGGRLPQGWLVEKRA